MFQPTSYLDKEVTNWLRSTTGWIAGDGGASLKLSNGKILWSFGDSHYNDYKDSTVICLFNTRNLVRVQMTEHNFNPEPPNTRSEEHTSELQPLMRISYDVISLNKKKN